MKYKMGKGRPSEFQKELLTLLSIGETQTSIARMMGVSQATVSYWLHGHFKPRWIKAVKKTVKQPVKSDPILDAINQISHLKGLLEEILRNR
jgi:predicted transcriptional regulator